MQRQANRATMRVGKINGRPQGSPLHFYTYITDGVLFQPLPVGFVRYLFRVVTYPGGSPLKIRTASTSSTVASSYSPAHALLNATTFMQTVYHTYAALK